jgi:glycogen debranching enzyme
MFVRPNMVIAASLPFGMLDNDQKKAVLDRVEGELLTPRGLRTLSPKNPAYKGVYRGDQKERDEAYHQGTVWPWLLGPFCEAWLRLYGKKGVKRVNDLIMQFNDVMTEHGVSSVSEVYDGDPPHMPGGTISQAWSVSELLRVLDITDQLSTGKEEVI